MRVHKSVLNVRKYAVSMAAMNQEQLEHFKLDKVLVFQVCEEGLTIGFVERKLLERWQRGDRIEVRYLHHRIL